MYHLNKKPLCDTYLQWFCGKFFVCVENLKICQLDYHVCSVFNVTFAFMLLSALFSEIMATKGHVDVFLCICIAIHDSLFVNGKESYSSQFVKTKLVIHRLDEQWEHQHMWVPL